MAEVREQRGSGSWLARLAGLFWRPAPPPEPSAEEPKPQRGWPAVGRRRALAPLRAEIGRVFREHREMLEGGGDLAAANDETLRKLNELRDGVPPDHHAAGEMMIEQAVIYVQLGMTYGNEFCDAAPPVASGSS